MATEKAPPGSPKRTRRGVALGALLGGQMEKASAEAGLTGRLAVQWGAICPLMAPYCWPVSVRRGVLTVAVTSDSVRNELHFMAPTIVEAVNLLAGYEAVGSLRYERRSRSALRSVPKRPAPAAAAVDMAKEACERIRDADLQAALQRLGAWIIKA